MAVKKKKRKSRDMYGSMRTPSDVVKINQKIRTKIRKARSRTKLTKYVRESLYLFTLTNSPTVKQGLSNITKVRAKTRSEFTKTARAANAKMKSANIAGKPYDTIIGRGR